MNGPVGTGAPPTGVPGADGAQGAGCPQGGDGSLRIVRLANFVAPSSGGLRTALRELGRGYRAAGHESVLSVPGERESDQETEQGRVVTLPGPSCPAPAAAASSPASGGSPPCWRNSLPTGSRCPTVRPCAGPADGRGGPGCPRSWSPTRAPTACCAPGGLPEGVARRTADALNVRTAHTYARVVCTTEFAEREFARTGARNVVRAPLGVDLTERHPSPHDPGLRARHARVAETPLVTCTRLSVERRPGTALDALEALLRRGAPARERR